MPAEFESVIPSGHIDELVVVFPGLAMPARHISRAFAPHLPPATGMITVEYPPDGVDITEITHRLAAEIARLRPARLRVYGASMGGMCAVAFLREFPAADPSGPQTILVLDTTPSGPADVRVPRMLSRLTSRYRGGPFGTFIWRQIVRRYSYAPVEPEVDPDLIESAHRAFADVDSATIVSQINFVRRYVATSADTWSRRADRAVFLRGVPAGGDPLIIVDSAVAAWRELVPHLQETRIAERLDTWHVPIIERPRETMTTIMNA